MSRFLLTPFTLFLSLWLLPGTAQEIPKDFARLTDSVLLLKPSTYEGLDAFLRPYRRDSVLVNYFIEIGRAHV